MGRSENIRPEGLPQVEGTYYYKFIWNSPKSFIDHNGHTVVGGEQAMTYVRFSEKGLSIPGQPHVNVTLYADDLEWYYNEGQTVSDGKICMHGYRKYLRKERFWGL